MSKKAWKRERQRLKRSARGWQFAFFVALVVTVVLTGVAFGVDPAATLAVMVNGSDAVTHVVKIFKS